MSPNSCAAIKGSAARTSHIAPFRFVESTVSQPSSVISSTVSGTAKPELLTSTSSEPKRSTACRTKPSHCSRTRTSKAYVKTRSAPAAEFNSSAVRLSTGSLREAMTTRAPACDSAPANARPMPVPPPVTSATCSVKGFLRSANAVRPPCRTPSNLSALALDEYARRARGHLHMNLASLDARLAANCFEAVFEARAVFEGRLGDAELEGGGLRVVVDDGDGR